MKKRISHCVVPVRYSILGGKDCLERRMILILILLKALLNKTRYDITKIMRAKNQLSKGMLSSRSYINPKENIVAQQKKVQQKWRRFRRGHRQNDILQIRNTHHLQEARIKKSKSLPLFNADFTISISISISKRLMNDIFLNISVSSQKHVAQKLWSICEACNFGMHAS